MQRGPLGGGGPDVSFRWVQWHVSVHRAQTSATHIAWKGSGQGRLRETQPFLSKLFPCSCNTTSLSVCCLTPL